MSTRAAPAADDLQGLDELYVGRGLIPKPSMSESQEILAEMQLKQGKKREEIFELKQRISEIQAADESERKLQEPH